MKKKIILAILFLKTGIILCSSFSIEGNFATVVRFSFLNKNMVGYFPCTDVIILDLSIML